MYQTRQTGDAFGSWVHNVILDRYYHILTKMFLLLILIGIIWMRETLHTRGLRFCTSPQRDNLGFVAHRSLLPTTLAFTRADGPRPLESCPSRGYGCFIGLHNSPPSTPPKDGTIHLSTSSHISGTISGTDLGCASAASRVSLRLQCVHDRHGIGEKGARSKVFGILYGPCIFVTLLKCLRLTPTTCKAT